MGRPPTPEEPPVFQASLSCDDLTEYVATQMDAFFPDGFPVRPQLKRYVTAALERMEHCVLRASLKGFHTKDGPRYHHLHTDQHAMFLYYLSNTVFDMGGPVPVAEKTYALNKTLHSLDVFYEVELPAVFALVHPVGTVLGRATYGDYFCAYQNVSVGADLDGNHPIFGDGVVMYGGSRIVGKVTVGDNCLISAGTLILGGDIPPNHVVFGQHPNVEAKATRHKVIENIFKPLV
ncbi:MAG: serine acetyltransferase [Rhodospirillaceae bacterium]|jgi:serine O-acetyltransferase|nr:serine acetyltransferase [Rhodospirillaceae bacterium]MBT5564906.1 serine acetyltransferase [Rhodospirillaceae bacterium]MBT6090553.1 serine acetyltransferase [Rhodospirillaceae bacterium]MBT6960092.1 serine acetyltransferase [Rhodospirillaceae bacterium]